MDDDENTALLQALMILNNNVIELARIMTTRDELESLEEAEHTFTAITEVTSAELTTAPITLRWDGESWSESDEDEDGDDENDEKE